MSSNRSRDEWADARLGETMHRALGSMATQAGRASELEAAMGTVRRRVRRRRAAKQAGIGATTLATAAGLVVGGSALLPLETPPPGPAQTPSPTAPSEPSVPTPSEPAPSESTPSESTPPDPESSDEPSPGTVPAVSLIKDGHQPSWLEGTDLVCGMSAVDPPASADGLELEVTGELTSQTTSDDTAVFRLPTRLTPPVDVPADVVLMGPTLVWTQLGRVVDVGVNTTEDPVQLEPGSEPLESVATDYSNTSCAPGEPVEGGPTSYPTALPAGEYQVQAFDVLWSDGYTESQLVYSEPVTVVLDETGALSSVQAGG